MEFLAASLPIIATQLPLLIIFIVGIAIAIRRWQAHPRVSLLAAIAFGVLLLDTALSIPITMLPLMSRNLGWSVAELGMVYSVIGLFRTAIHVACWIVLLFTIFGWRDSAMHSSKHFR